MLQDDSLKERFSVYRALVDWKANGTFLREHSLSPFAMELALGVCRRHLLLLHAIRKGVAKNSGEKAETILEMGLFQLFFMDSVPEHAAIDTSAELARMALGEGAVRLVNGFLRNAARNGLPALPPQNVQRISIQYSVPDWIVRRWLDEGGIAEAENRAKETLATPVQWIRVNTAKTTLEKLRAELGLTGRDYAGRYLEVSGKDVHLGKLLKSDAFAKGLFSVQNPAAYDVVNLLRCESGNSVWDACAAPGGKAALLAEMCPGATVLATDVSAARLRDMDDIEKRLGLKNVKCAAVDALNSGFADKFDRVLLDVPCTNMGVLSRRPEALYRIKAEDFKTLPEMQFAILTAASKALKAGGRLVYATCSPERVETTRVIDRFLTENVAFKTAGEPVRIGANDLGLDHFFAQALEKAK